jgi:hypothetical protein
MKIFGHELIWRKVLPDEPFEFHVSYPLVFAPNDRYIRLEPKDGYRIVEGIDTRWIDTRHIVRDGARSFMIQDIAYHDNLDKRANDLLERTE